MSKPSFRTCNNACVFCFVDQLPGGLRESLCVKDEDHRLSYLFGNFVTLTNVSPSELDQIVDLGMSPLYVSVHVTDPEVRIRMLRNKRAGAIMDQLRRLLSGQIEVHVQIVICPGWNDGVLFERSLEDLWSLSPPPASVGVVPVGLTAHREGLTPLSPVSAQGSRDALALMDAYQERCRSRLGIGWVYGADELFLRAGQSIPPAAYYDEFPQEENGIGLIRRFMEEGEAILPEIQFKGPRTAIATGRLFAPFLRRMLKPLEASGDVLVKAVKSELLGDPVSVAGLMAGQDLLAAESEFSGAKRLLIPDSCLSQGGRRRFLDGFTVPQISERLGLQVVPVDPTGRGLADALSKKGGGR